MTNPPRTVEQARVRRYGVYAKTLGGWGYVEGNCAYQVRRESFQCIRANGHGPADLYCKQHAKMLERGKG